MVKEKSGLSLFCLKLKHEVKILAYPAFIAVTIHDSLEDILKRADTRRIEWSLVGFSPI